MGVVQETSELLTRCWTTSRRYVRLLCILQQPKWDFAQVMDSHSFQSQKIGAIFTIYKLERDLFGLGHLRYPQIARYSSIHKLPWYVCNASQSNHSVCMYHINYLVNLLRINLSHKFSENFFWILTLFK